MRRALIVATDAYSDKKLARLNAPATDARELATVLQDPSVGAFEVDTVLNKTCHEAEVAIARFLAGGRRGDTLLLHFSCHGVKDLSGELYFAATDTDTDPKMLRVTGVASSMVKDAVDESRASLILCLVDCCYSGAFAKTKDAATADLTERLGGQGRAVIMASTSLQLALDGEEQPSLFTHAVVEGLRSGEADRDLDGLVSLDEFYNFVYDRVTEVNPDQTPVKSFNVQGEVYLARRPSPVTTPSPLPGDLLETLATGEVWQRRGVVTRLAELLVCGHPGTALAARLELERIASPDPTVGDDSGKVRTDAIEVLASVPLEQTQAIPEIPDTVPEVVDLGSDLVGAGTKSSTDIETAPDVEAEPETEPDVGTDGGTDTDEEGEAPSDSEEQPEIVEPTPTKWWKRRGVVIGAAAALVLAGGGVASYVVLGGGLPESELVIAVGDDEGKTIMAVDTNGDNAPRELGVPQGAGLPALSRDRTSLFYLVGGGGAHQPWRSSLDGTDAEELFDASAREMCPDASKPAEKPDDGTLAFVCGGGPDGEGIALLDDGELSWVLPEPYPIRGPLTWQGDDTLVFTMALPDSETTRLYELDLDDPSDYTELTLTESGWLSQPHWSPDGGLLFLRSDDNPFQENIGDVFVKPDGETATQQTCDASNGAPTWSPDGRQFAFLTGPIAASSLHVQTASDDACGSSEEVSLDGGANPPWWGAR